MRKKEEYQAEWYTSPINLEARRVGKMEVRHRIIPKGEEVIIVGARQALLRGIRPVCGTTKQPLRIHELVEHVGKTRSLWMTDLPEELNQIGEMLHNVGPQGNVLVGGLGLGILAAIVARREDVSEVVVVERARDVIKLCARPDLYQTKCSDILKYLRGARRTFDYYLLDTWQGTNEGTWWNQVMPLRRAIRQRHGLGPEIHCWAEDIMWGQISRSLQVQGTMGFTPTWHYTHLPCPMTQDETAAFLNMVGTPWWEREYGKAVDRYFQESKERAS